MEHITEHEPFTLPLTDASAQDENLSAPSGAEDTLGREPNTAGDTAPDAGEQSEDFETLIRGRYKEQFDARVRKIIDARLRGLRQENESLRRQKESRRETARRALESLAAGEAAVQAVYPDYRWQKELKDPAFGRLVLSGAEPLAAYELVHRDELLRRAMDYAAERTARQTARSIASVRRRVAENGGRSVSVTRSDPRALSSRELADIRRRVMEGEKIRF